MWGRWTFRRAMSAHLALMLALAVTGLGVTVHFAHRAAEADARALVSARRLAQGEQLGAGVQLWAAATRAYASTAHVPLQADAERAWADSRALLDDLDIRATTPTESLELARLARAMDARQLDPSDAVQPFDRALIFFLSAEEARTAAALASASASRRLAIGWAAALVGVIGLLAASGFSALRRGLTRQIGDAAQQVRMSSHELECVAAQQASGSRDQMAAMGEIGTTLRELLAASHHVAEGAQGVARIAAASARAADEGRATLAEAEASAQIVLRQVTTMDTLLSDVGRKSAHIGALLEVVDDLAEQTNILAINATIEATDTGDGGHRFAIVAAEIRRLADRVLETNHQIRGLLDDTRQSVTATLATTGAATAGAAAGGRHLVALGTSLHQIAQLVDTAADTAREIELSAQHQASTVSQVNGAVSTVSHTTHELQAGAQQTLQTASELALLSRGLTRIVLEPAVA